MPSEYKNFRKNFRGQHFSPRRSGGVAPRTEDVTSPPINRVVLAPVVRGGRQRPVGGPGGSRPGPRRDGGHPSPARPGFGLGSDEGIAGLARERRPPPLISVPSFQTAPGHSRATSNTRTRRWR